MYCAVGQNNEHKLFTIIQPVESIHVSTVTNHFKATFLTLPSHSLSENKVWGL